MATLVLAGCGFRPVYGERSSVADLAAIEIATIPERVGQRLRNVLVDELHAGGRDPAPRYLLEVVLERREVDLGIRKDATATRAQVQLGATYRLLERGTDRVVTGGRATSISSYNLLESEFATRATADDALENAVRDLGEDLADRLALYFATRES